MIKKYKVDFYWVAFFVVLLVFIKMSILGFYFIPSESMEPNLIAGDRILVNKVAYGLTIPFFSTPIFNWSSPNRGDIILFSFDGSKEIFIKRVIAVEGDFISFHEGQVFVNNEPLKLIPTKDNIEILSHSLSTLYYEENSKLGMNRHQISMSTYPATTFFERRRFLVPKGKLFVLGDNRDNSADSRVSGYVDIQKVYGKSNFLLFSTKGDKLWPNFRSGRTFRSIE